MLNKNENVEFVEKKLQLQSGNVKEPESTPTTVL